MTTRAFKTAGLFLEQKKSMRGSKNLPVVDTIYEEEHENELSSVSTSCPSPSVSPNPTPLHTAVDAWSLATGCKPDVLIRVQGTSFHLHKDRLISRSSYLKRRLREVSDFTVSPPLNITAETFAGVAEFCYSSNIELTLDNVAALRVAAELLELTEAEDSNDENLRQITETYFRTVIGMKREYASILFRASLALLPDAEKTAFLVSRCVEAWMSTESIYDGDRDDKGVTACFEDVITLRMEDFELVVDSMSRRLHNHDELYRIVQLYLKNAGKVTEEQKNHLWNFVDTSKLTHEVLIEAIQSVSVPLRFLVRAMLTEQLKNVVSTASNCSLGSNWSSFSKESVELNSLSSTMQHDVALQQAANLRETMEATSCRIQSLEKELRGMKKLLVQEQMLSERQRNHVEDSGRSQSFHSFPDNPRLGRGERRSTSSASFRLSTKEESRGSSVYVIPSSEGSCSSTLTATPTQNRTPTKTLRHRLISGLKNAFLHPKVVFGVNVNQGKMNQWFKK